MTVAGIPDSLQRKLDSLPTGPGVYLWKDRHGVVLYVGKAANLRSRVRNYVGADFEASGQPKDQMLRRLIADLDTIVTESVSQSLLLENSLIKEYQPRFNVRLKDDKSYPSIAVTLKEPFPRVLVTRQRDIPGARYFGPYTDVGEMRRALALVRRIFTVRSCDDDLPGQRRERPCLDFHIGRCLAPCVGWQDQPAYRAMIDEVIAFLEGHTVDVRTRVREMMREASEREDYERARDLRDTLKWLDEIERPATIETIGTGDADVIGYARDGDDAVGVLFRIRDGRITDREHRFLENVEAESDAEILAAFLVRYYIPLSGRANRVVLSFTPSDLAQIELLTTDVDWTVPQRGTARRWLELADRNAQHLMESLRLESFEAEERSGDPVYALGRDLGLVTVPRTMVCVDISTSQGKDTVGSLVTFEAGRPKKSEYRKFRIKGAGQQDDFAAVHEVVTRYLTRRSAESKPLPDLMVIDGGKGQLSAAVAAAQATGASELAMISLAKRDEEVFLPGTSEPLRLPRRSPSLRLLQRIRDEAHRFGLAYNRNRRRARTITSSLLEIPGVGAERRRRLLERFGSLAGVRTASPAEIATVPGISSAMATKILDHLRAP